LNRWVIGLGGEAGRRKAGEHYRDHAPRYEWTLGLIGLSISVGVSLFFSGSSLSGVISPLLGAVFGGLFFLSHFGVDTKTPLNVSLPKAAAMAVIYGTLIAVTPFPIIDLLQKPTLSSGILFAGLISGWATAIGIHRFL
jgi:hypothetical protein